jgi:hypothetical protein
MSPVFEPDFDWGEVQATTPVYPKGDYELTIKSVRGSAWPKTDKNGNPTGEITMVVRFRPEMVGAYDSKDKLSSKGPDGKDIKGGSCEDINLWIHSDGGRKMAKGYMMAVLGYNPRDGEQEKLFNKFLKDQKADLSASVEENDDGSLSLKIGGGWEQLFVGKNVRAHMDEEIREIEGRDPVTQQNYVRLQPVNL